MCESPFFFLFPFSFHFLLIFLSLAYPELNSLINEATTIYKSSSDPSTLLDERYQRCLQDFRLYSEANDMATEPDFRYLRFHPSLLSSYLSFIDSFFIACFPPPQIDPCRIGVQRNMGMVAYKAATLSLDKHNLDRAVYHVQGCVHHLVAVVAEEIRFGSRGQMWRKAIEVLK